MKSVMSGDQLREDRMALDNLLANLPQAKPGKSSSLEMTPYSTPQLSPATTPANKKNRLPIGKTRGSLRTMHGVVVPLRVVPSPTGLPSPCPRRRLKGSPLFRPEGRDGP